MHEVQRRYKRGFVWWRPEGLAYEFTLAALGQRVLASQKTRLFVQEAMKNGEFPSWDYSPPFDAGRAYVRGAFDPSTTATKARKRFPFVPTTPPQNPRPPK